MNCADEMLEYFLNLMERKQNILQTSDQNISGIPNFFHIYATYELKVEVFGQKVAVFQRDLVQNISTHLNHDKMLQ